MKIKRYEGPETDLPTLMLRVKKDLGDNAVIKTQSFKKGGFLGIGGTRWVRILAGVEEQNISNGERPGVQEKITNESPRRFSEDDIRKDRRVEVNLDNSPAIKGIMDELKTLRESIDNLKQDEEKKQTTMPRVEMELPGWFEYLRQLLEKGGMNREVAKSLAEGVIEITPPEDRADFDKVKSRFVEYMVSMVVKPNNNPESDDDTETGQRIIILIGPTGVGKTTTLAKLAANFALLEEKSVCLITADTYRIAAIDQLRTFA
ncbi:MAG: hypothetical protein ABIG42_10985, partial [bacterium]